MSTSHPIVIVGAGFAGLGMAIRLKRSGIDDFVILERASRVGGVWRENHYPGAACDIESHLYSFSFQPNPDWQYTFGRQAEILAYLQRCADDNGLGPHLRLDTAATGARFDEESGTWHIDTNIGQSFVARAVVLCVGGLTVPAKPQIPGLSSFKGKVMHSAEWDDDYSIEGKTVAVIGTGASAIQIVPAIAPRVGKLHVFQRTPPWIVPKIDPPIAPETRERFRRFPVLQRVQRARQYVRHEMMAPAFVLAPRLMAPVEWLVRKFIEKSVRDPVLRDKVTPRYRMGCKRVLPSNDWYPALQRPNVELVTDGIEAVTETGIRTRDGRERAVDTIVLATGFHAADFQLPFTCKGRGGQDINEGWKSGPEAYLGTTVSGFPNAFIIVGPNTGLGHNSMVYMMESQIAYILDALRVMRERGLKLVDVRPEAQAAYNDELQRRLAKTVWSTGGCASWYHNKDGKNTTLWPGFTFEYRHRTRRFDADAYEMVKADASERAVPSANGQSGRATASI